jgi:hypothetical protein
MNFNGKLNDCSDFSCIFNLVKVAVEITIGRRRVGLMLGLSELPIYIGALHQLGSNFIIMNKILFKKVLSSKNKQLINAYVFHVLLHEYLHALGYVNEQETQILSYLITEKTLGQRHPATLIAKHGIGSVFANLDMIEDFEHEEVNSIDIVENFEEDNLDYFG